MKGQAHISGIVSRYGLGDGDWFDAERYAALGVRIGEALLKRNPSKTFCVVQVCTTHNPIRLWVAEGSDSLDLSGSMSLRGLRPLCWSRPVMSQYWDENSNSGYGDWVETADHSAVDARIFQVCHGTVVYRRDNPGLVDGIHEP